MSDTGRKDITQQIGEKVTPDQEKTAGERVKEAATGAYDRVAAAVTPDSKKSIPQQATDKVRGAK